MDPIATLAIMADREESDAARMDALQNLADWIANGGGVDQFAALSFPIDPEDYIDFGLFETACAVRCAIFNGDLSALEGLGYEVTR